MQERQRLPNSDANDLELLCVLLLILSQLDQGQVALSHAVGPTRG